MDKIKKLKKLYGEKFVQLCRDICPIGYQQIDQFYDVLTTSFAPTHSLYEDISQDDNEIESLQTFLNSFFVEEKIELPDNNNLSPEELLDKAGYILYPECQTEEEIQSFIKYYEEDEELCTFTNGNRLEFCHVWFAVKKNVDQIKRENFPNPERQDEYGTSVLSIQFRRQEPNILSIKNRYNHTVENCDSTFNNNLDNIIPGLTKAFLEKYNLSDVNYNGVYFQPADYVMAKDGRLYRYNLERGIISFCENNYVIKNNIPTQYDKSRYLIIDEYLIDKQERIITNLVNDKQDSFIESIGEFEKIETVSEENGETVIKITPKEKIRPDVEDIEITIDKYNQIVKIFNANATKIGDDFLKNTRTLKEIILPNTTHIGKGFNHYSANLETFIGNKVTNIEEYFLYNNILLKKFEVESLEYLGKYSLVHNLELEKLNLPAIKKIGGHCFNCNKEIDEIYAPNLEDIYDYSFSQNQELMELDTPKLKYIGSCVLGNNKVLQKITFSPNVLFCGSALRNHPNKKQIIGNVQQDYYDDYLY